MPRLPSRLFYPSDVPHLPPGKGSMMTKGSENNDTLLEVANNILRHHKLQAIACKRLQRLWAGYGHICSLEAVSTDDSTTKLTRSLILKHVTPPKSAGTKDEGHLRKLISYQVEQYFYSHLAPETPPSASMAQRLTGPGEVHSYESSISMILTDLKLDFPVAGEKRGMLSHTQVHAALKWLGTFHGYWWKHRDDLRRHKLRLPPLEEVTRPASDAGSNEGIWLNGGYTYLATRLKEYNELKLDNHSEWSGALCQPTEMSKSVAEMAAQVLTPLPDSNSKDSAIADYETLIHGDVKSENLFSSTNGKEVAFYDFQYVGLGLGVCDLAKLFTVSVPLECLTQSDLTEMELCPMCDGERGLLEVYRDILQQESGKLYPIDELYMHWNTALIDWLRFQAGWGFWGNTQWLEARGRYILNDPKYMNWLAQTAEPTTT
ncbi:hypothetical protein AC578_2661 [Pseudocercospora eumusae]|uniref:Aminoglycoside phosphotransferase domain-containing protein n=1 Tax=Pseudocercospora eumusae TaxID=321146 RepID=A0A139H156_9PEZI|nr:hypothetical protein AC578_2661 [Pseudocercospora eumusae]